MNPFLCILKLKGFPIKKAQDDLNRLKRLSEEDFQSYVEEKKWAQFNYFLQYNSVYKKLIGGKTIKEWGDLPIITKQHIQMPLEHIISDGFTKDSLFINKTSGSSGTPFFFAKDKDSHAKTWALVLDRYSRHGINYGKSLQARFYGIPLSGLGFYKEKLKDYLSKRVRFPIFDISDEKLAEFVSIFSSRKFEYINGYTSSLVYFAQYLIARNLVLKEICPSLKICFPTSEMCTEQDRAYLEAGFGIRVANEYGCAEMDILAFEDENFDWIMSNENVFFEIVDELGREVQPGMQGRILITSLYNKAMPLIRYEIGDIGSVRSDMKGNYAILDQLIGRKNEFAILPSGRKVPALTFYYITKTLIQEEYGIKEFVIKQKSLREFKFEYVSTDKLPNTAIKKITEAMDEYLEPNLIASFEQKDIIERTKAGKLKQFYNLIAQ
jgi:phenylacetate-CoA ligase